MRKKHIYYFCIVYILMTALAVGQESTTPVNYKENRPLDSTLIGAVREVEAISGKSLCLNPPASDTEIDKAEIVLNQLFSEDLRELYKIANGQRVDSECAPLFWDGGSFMSLSDMTRQWNIMRELWEDQESFRTDYGLRGAVRGVHWTPEWVPVGDFGNGDLFCIDYAPTESGAIGQIIYFVHDDIVRSLVSEDIKSFIGSLDDALRRNVVSYAPGYGVRLSN